jgi:Fe-S cluster assembly ATP-binding protein
MAYFLRAALNAQNKHAGKEEMDAVEFLTSAKKILSELDLAFLLFSTGKSIIN